MAGGTPKIISTREADCFKLMPKDLEKAITPNTKVLLLSYPNNPTGAIMDRKDCRPLRVVEKYDLLVISDEIYSG